MHLVSLYGYDDCLSLLLEQGKKSKGGGGDGSASPMPDHIIRIIDDNEDEEGEDGVVKKSAEDNEPNELRDALLRSVDEGGRTVLHLAAHSGNEECGRLLVSRKCDVNAVDKQGLTPLHIACMNDKMPFAEFLLARGAKIEGAGGKEGGGVTPLHVSAYRGHIDCVKSLIVKGARLHAKDSQGRTPLHYLASFDLSLLEDDESLGGKKNHNSKKSASKSDSGKADNQNEEREEEEEEEDEDEDLWGVPIVAETKVAKFLVRKGCSLEAQDAQGRNPLHYALLVDNLEIADIFMKADTLEAGNQLQASKQAEVRNAIVAVDGVVGASALHIMAKKGKAELLEAMVKILLADDSPGDESKDPSLRNKSVDMLDVVDKKGRTPLHWAAFYGQTECLSVLLRYKVNPFAKDADGKTPFFLASLQGHVKCLDRLLFKDSLMGSLSSSSSSSLFPTASSSLSSSSSGMFGHPLWARDNEGRLPLHAAAYNGHLAVIEVLLDSESSFSSKQIVASAKDDRQQTLLHKAAAGGQRNCTRRLIEEYGAEVNPQDVDGWTPLMLAACRGPVGVVHLLLERGARLDLTDTQWKRTALHWAVVSGCIDCAILLLQKGQPDVACWPDGDGLAPLDLLMRERKGELERGESPELDLLKDRLEEHVAEGKKRAKEEEEEKRKAKELEEEEKKRKKLEEERLERERKEKEERERKEKEERERKEKAEREKQEREEQARKEQEERERKEKEEREEAERKEKERKDREKKEREQKSRNEPQQPQQPQQTQQPQQDERSVNEVGTSKTGYTLVQRKSASLAGTIGGTCPIPSPFFHVFLSFRFLLFSYSPFLSLFFFLVLVTKRCLP